MKLNIIYPGTVQIYGEGLTIATVEFSFEKAGKGEPWEIGAAGTMHVSELKSTYKELI